MKKYKKIKSVIQTFCLIFSLLIFCLATGWLVPLSQAQESGSELSVFPPTAFIKVKPGSRVTHTITIENTSSQLVALKPIFYDFTSDGQTGLPNLSPDFTFPYLDIPPGGFPEVQIPARSKAQLTLMFAPPSSAKDGEYPITVVFQSDPLQTNGQTRISQGIGSNIVVLVTSQDKAPALLSIDQIKTPRLVDSFAAFKSEAVLSNNGLSAQVASGSASLKDWRGYQVANFTLYPDIVLGHSTRLARSLLVNSNPTSEDNPYSTADFQLEPSFRIGLYTWEFKLLQDTNNYQVKSVRVLALPWVAMVLSSTGIGLLVFWHFLSQKRSR